MKKSQELNKKNIEDASPSNLDTIRDSVEVIGKIAIGLFVILYAIGLIVVNIHLNKFGVYSLSLFRLNYVTAGTWTLVPIFFVFQIIFVLVSIIYLLSQKFRNFITNRFQPTSNEQKEATREHLGTVLLAVLFFSAIGIFIFIKLDLKEMSREVWEGFYTGAIVIAYLLVWLHITLKPFHLLSRFVSSYVSILICLVVFIAYITTFATGLYGKIPSFLGGGSPQKAQLILDEESKIKEKLESIGVVFRPSTLTANVQILLATDDEYILLIESTDSEGRHKLKGLTLPKDLIKAVLYEEGGGYTSGKGGAGV